MRNELELDNIRENLIRQEETIIFYLIERAQFKANCSIYKKDFITIDENKTSFLDYLLLETEKIHAKVRRYQSPDEVPFNKNLPEPIISDFEYSWPIRKITVSVNDIILKKYTEEVVPLICEKGDDGNYGSSAVNDVAALQAISKRIHYGRYVAESKYQSSKEKYDSFIKTNDHRRIFEEITNRKVEEKLLERVYKKALTYGQFPDNSNNKYKISPDKIKKIYKEIIIPLTKEVECTYLLTDN